MKTTTKWCSGALLTSLLLVGCSPMMDVDSIGQAIQELPKEQQEQLIEEYVAPIIEEYFMEAMEEAITIEEPNVHSDEALNELVQNIIWTIQRDEWGDTVATGVLENTTDKTIDYIEIEYKFIKDGVTVDSSFTNAVNIAPGEKVKVEIYTFEEFDTLQVQGTDGF